LVRPLCKRPEPRALDETFCKMSGIKMSGVQNCREYKCWCKCRECTKPIKQQETGSSVARNRVHLDQGMKLKVYGRSDSTRRGLMWHLPQSLHRLRQEAEPVRPIRQHDTDSVQHIMQSYCCLQICCRAPRSRQQSKKFPTEGCETNNLAKGRPIFRRKSLLES
jgi:hypothetical protein